MWRKRFKTGPHSLGQDLRAERSHPARHQPDGTMHLKLGQVDSQSNIGVGERRARRFDRTEVTAQFAKIDYHVNDGRQRDAPLSRGGQVSCGEVDMVARDAMMQNLAIEFNLLEQRLDSIQRQAHGNGSGQGNGSSQARSTQALANAKLSYSTTSGPVSPHQPVSGSGANTNRICSPKSSIGHVQAGGEAKTPERNLPARTSPPPSATRTSPPPTIRSAMPLAEIHTPVVKSSSMV
jgi:hypothetical protein